MKTFKDNNGREWKVEINVGTIMQVRDLANINIYKLIENEMKPLAELMADPCELAHVLYCLCKQQIDAAGIAEIDFYRGLAGDCLTSAHDAFWEEFVNFFRDPKIRDNLRLMEKKGRAVMDLLCEQARQEIEAVDVEKAANGLKDGFGKRQESSGSTPAHLLSAS